MIYSKSTQYGIRALLCLAKLPSGEVCRMEVVAKETGIPQQFLSKIMQRLARKRLVKSTKGYGGGFALQLRPQQITLLMIADAIEDLGLTMSDCIFGNSVCGDRNPCPLHESWVKVRGRQLKFLEGITIGDLAAKLSKESTLRTRRSK